MRKEEKEEKIRTIIELYIRGIDNPSLEEAREWISKIIPLQGHSDLGMTS